MSVSDLRLTLGPRGFQWVHGASRRVVPWVGGGDGDTPDTIEVPDDLTVLTDEDIEQLHVSVAAELDALRDRATSEPGSVTADDAARAALLSEAFTRLNDDRERRSTEQQSLVDTVLSAVDQANGGSDDGEGDGNGDEGSEEAPTPPPAVGDPVVQPEADPSPDPQPAEGEPTTEGLVPVAASSRRQPLRVPAQARRATLNPRLRLQDIARNAPAPALPADVGPELTVTAASDVPGFGSGDRLPDIAALADAVTARASSLPITHGKASPAQIATVTRQFPQSVEWDSTADVVEAALAEVLGAAPTRRGMEAVVAAGGWCAPSEIRYDFFGVEDTPTGLVDLPTIGIRRGGLRWPESLSLADFFALSGAPASGVATNATMPWLWTETDDILAVTGSPTKACLRPPCPDFQEKRLELFGACVLAGNLTEEAYPEVIRRFVALTMLAHAHVMNRRHIALMLADPTVTAVTPTVGASTSVFTHLLGAAELYAEHLRRKYGASDNAVVELMYPAHVRAIARNDLARRNGWDDLSATDAFIGAQYDARNIRVQWVHDWQDAIGWAAAAGTIGAATAPTAWPSAWNGLMFFPGHFFKGNGMRLNLGAMRDSVLNETNDHTVAWTEEATLIGARGSEALLIQHSGIYPEGTTGAQVDQSAASA